MPSPKETVEKQMVEDAAAFANFCQRMKLKAWEIGFRGERGLDELALHMWKDVSQTRKDTVEEVLKIASDVLNKKAGNYNNEWGVNTCAALVAGRIEMEKTIRKQFIDNEK